MNSGNPLGDYLRARRELVRPADVGLPDLGRRRVPGLRREELAMLAGISSDYYLRLEQGRDQHPSEQVIEALARALQLDEGAALRLHQLGRPAPRRRRAPHRLERTPAGIRQLVASWSNTPAYVYGRYMDVLVANPLATALSPVYTAGVNQLRAAFLDPAVRDLYRDWEAITESCVAGLRTLIGPEIDDPVLADLVGELSVRSERFRRLWARCDLRPKSSGTSCLDHPQVGPLELRYEKLAIAGTAGQVLVVYHAEPGGPSAQALTLLASIATAEEEPGHQEPASTGPARFHRN